jgi:hypothetical protein
MEIGDCLFTQYSFHNGVRYVRCNQCAATGIIRECKFTLIRPHTCLVVEEIDLESCVSDNDCHVIDPESSGSDADQEDDSYADSNVDSHADSVDEENELDMKDDDEERTKKLKQKMEKLKKIKKASTSSRNKML